MGTHNGHAGEDAFEQANAATRLALQPREIPAATVYSTPAPGVATTISVVSRNSGVTG
jgi:hypothetical protein